MTMLFSSVSGAVSSDPPVQQKRRVVSRGGVSQRAVIVCDFSKRSRNTPAPHPELFLPLELRLEEQVLLSKGLRQMCKLAAAEDPAGFFLSPSALFTEEGTTMPTHPHSRRGREESEQR